jgi:hypothetical protein
MRCATGCGICIGGFATLWASLHRQLAPLGRGAFSAPRAVKPTVIWCRWVCLHATGANPGKELSPASAGFFVRAAPSRRATNLAVWRWVLGLLITFAERSTAANASERRSLHRASLGGWIRRPSNCRSCRKGNELSEDQFYSCPHASGRRHSFRISIQP